MLEWVGGSREGREREWCVDMLEGEFGVVVGYGRGWTEEVEWMLGGELWVGVGKGLIVLE